MSIATLILGESGRGKTDSMHTLDPNKTLLIKPDSKQLPFFEEGWAIYDKEQKRGNVFVTDQAAEILALMLGTKRKIIVLDDFQYVMANEFMRRGSETGYMKFTEIGFNAWSIMKRASELAADVRVYLLSHTETADDGQVRMKTIGKLLNEKITPEGLFPIVMRAVVRDGQYLFTTKNSGFDTVKTPRNLFKEETIPNDLAYVDAQICRLYKLNEARQET